MLGNSNLTLPISSVVLQNLLLLATHKLWPMNYENITRNLEFTPQPFARCLQTQILWHNTTEELITYQGTRINLKLHPKFQFSLISRLFRLCKIRMWYYNQISKRPVYKDCKCENSLPFLYWTNFIPIFQNIGDL